MAKRLASFAIDNDGEDYLIRIESEDGETLKLTATYDQLDIISEDIDQRLNADEEKALEVAQDD